MISYAGRFVEAFTQLGCRHRLQVRRRVVSDLDIVAVRIFSSEKFRLFENEKTDAEQGSEVEEGDRDQIVWRYAILDQYQRDEDITQEPKAADVSE